MEINLPALAVYYPESILLNKVNINDDLKFDIEYYKSPDEAFYSLIMFYELNIVSTKRFEFTSFKFKIWDLFSDFN